MKKDCRAIAALCLASVQQGASLNQQIPAFEERLTERDRPLFRQLCYGTLRAYPKLLAVSEQLLTKPLKKKDSDILMLVLLGGYQLTESRVPDHAAVAATVNACRALKKPWAKGLINGVLRQWQRSGDALLAKLSAAARSAHPEWLYQQLVEAWPEQLESILSANNLQAPLCLRNNQQRGKRDAYLEQLADAGFEATACQYADQGIRLKQAMSVEQLPDFFTGRASVQDEAPQLGIDLLGLAPGQRVLDACAAPGGKTGHILESEPALSELVALEKNPQRLTRINDNLQRLQLQARVLCGDASQAESWWDGESFDRILLDAPCSATGVIRRNPDIKLHRQPDDILNLQKLQGEILDALWPTLAADGLLLYATCSLLPTENEQQVAAFCLRHSDAQMIKIDADWGVATPHGRQLFPQISGHDGFFYALLKKQL